MKPFNALLLQIMPGLLLSCILSTSVAYGAGPMTHMNDGLYYLDLVAAQGPLDQAEDAQLIDDSNSEKFFLLGTMFPDLGSAIDGLGFSAHDRALGIALLEAANLERDKSPWKIAFARGYIQHVCTDISAQLFQTQAMSIASGLGELDLFDGVMDDHPGGEDELLVEMAIDFYYGDFNLLLDIIEYFFQDAGQQPAARFELVLDFWYQTARNLYGSGIISESALYEQIDEFVVLINVAEPFIRERFLNTVLRRLQRNSLGEILDEWMTTAQKYLSKQEDATLQMDLEELSRVEDTDFFSDRDFFSWYFDDFLWLGPSIHQHFDVGDLWYQKWPTWDAEIMRSTGIQGLAMAWPERFDGTWEVIVSSALFKNKDTGQNLSSLTASSLPSRVQAQVEVYATVPADKTIKIRVMKDLSGGYLADTVCSGAETSQQLFMDPADYDIEPRPVLKLEFDPSLCISGAKGLYLEVIIQTGSSNQPFYTANWEAFDGIPNRDITQAPYQILYAPDSQRTGYISVR